MDDKKVLLSLKDVSIKFNVRGRILTAIRNVSLDIYDKETIAIVGESGSGKSVLTKTFAGMLDSNGFISNGSIVFSDDELSKTTVKNTGFNKKIFDHFLKKLNEYSYLEAGAAEFNAIINETEEYNKHFALTEEEEEDFEVRLKEANDNIIDCTNYINSLDKRDKNDQADLAAKRAELAGLMTIKNSILKEKNDLLAGRKANAQTNLKAKMEEEIINLKHRRDQVIEEATLHELPQETIKRNIELCKEVILSISRYPFFSKIKYVSKLLKRFKDAMCRGVNLNSDEERNKVFDPVVFRVKYLRDLTEQELNELDDVTVEEEKPTSTPKSRKIASLILLGLSAIIAVLIAIPGNITTVIVPKTNESLLGVSLFLKYLLLPLVNIIIFLVLKAILYKKDLINTTFARSVRIAPILFTIIANLLNVLLYTFIYINKGGFGRFLGIFLLVGFIILASLFVLFVNLLNKNDNEEELKRFDLIAFIASLFIDLVCFLIVKARFKGTLLVESNDYFLFMTFLVIVIFCVYYFFIYHKITAEDQEDFVNQGFLGHAIIDCAKVKFTKDWEQIRGRKIATVFQDPMTSLNPIITIGKQIMAVILKHQKCSYDEAKERAIDIMEKVGIPDAKGRFNDYPFQYSGGMRQRIVIAIALSCQPKILICDEPTTALDVTIQAQIIRLIKDLQKELGFTTVFITHDLGVVANVADRVAVLYGGQIVEIGTVEEVFYDPRHPYTWALLSSLPQLSVRGSELFSIPGTPPSLYNKIVGDAFAPRNKYAMAIDLVKEPPMFKVSETHFAKTWLLDPRAPHVDKPENICDLHEKMVKSHEGIL